MNSSFVRPVERMRFFCSISFLFRHHNLNDSQEQRAHAFNHFVIVQKTCFATILSQLKWNCVDIYIKQRQKKREVEIQLEIEIKIYEWFVGSGNCGFRI